MQMGTSYPRPCHHRLIQRFAMHTAPLLATLVQPTISTLELAPSFSYRFAQYDTEWTATALHAHVQHHREDCEDRGVTPEFSTTTVRHALEVYRVMARNSRKVRGPDGRDLYVNSLSIEQLYQRCGKSIHKRYLRPAIDLLRRTGVVADISPDLLPAKARALGAVPVEVEPQALVDAHNTLYLRMNPHLADADHGVDSIQAPVKVDARPVKPSPATVKTSPRPVKISRQADLSSQDQSIQQQQQPNIDSVDDQTTAMDMDWAWEAAGAGADAFAGALQEQEPERRSVRVTPKIVGLIDRLWQSTPAVADTPLTLSYLLADLDRGHWTLQGLANLMLRVRKDAGRWTNPPGMFRRILQSPTDAETMNARTLATSPNIGHAPKVDPNPLVVQALGAQTTASAAISPRPVTPTSVIDRHEVAGALEILRQADPEAAEAIEQAVEAELAASETLQRLNLTPDRPLYQVHRLQALARHLQAHQTTASINAVCPE